MATAINGRSDLPVYAAVVGGDKLVLSSRATGAAVDLLAPPAASSPRPTNEVAGRDALYELDGVAAPPSATNVVEDAIPGVRAHAQGHDGRRRERQRRARPAIDRAKVKDEVKAFVDAYNALVTATRAKTTEKRSRTRRRRRTTTRARSSATPA